uniref:Uncharacterized protein n=1 Tax=Romanomermis culicivorax TaxID=13658 RepID=A0A915JNP4_ROMCU
MDKMYREAYFENIESGYEQFYKYQVQNKKNDKSGKHQCFSNTFAFVITSPWTDGIDVAPFKIAECTVNLVCVEKYKKETLTFDVKWIDNIMIYEFEIWMTYPMFYVFFSASKMIV